MPSNTPSSERSLAGRIGAHAKWATTADRSAATAPARRALDERFDREVDPDNLLDPVERARRAASARRAYYSRLALKSAQSRRKAAAYTAAAEQAEAEMNGGGPRAA